MAFEFVEQTGSTNADLLARIDAHEHVPEGYWLAARKQDAGRGRQGRQWSDGEGNFMGSTIVHCSDHCPPKHSLALVTALAVYEAIVPFLAEPEKLMLKWPNDVLLSGAKLAGILLEARVDSVVIGIGVNLRVAPELPDRQTVALAHIGVPPALEDFAASLAKTFDAELERWRNFGLDTLIRRWLAAAHPVGTPVSVHDGSADILTGHFAGLTAEGALRLRLANGEERAIQAGDIVIDQGEP